MEDANYRKGVLIEIAGVFWRDVWYNGRKETKSSEGEYGMDKLMYMMMIEKTKTYNKITKKVIEEHVENIRRLDDEGKLEICGVFKGYPGMAGMYILKTESREEAEELCKREPLVVGGYAKYKLVSFQAANRENNYLL